MYRFKKYFLLIKSNPILVVLFIKDVLRYGIRSSIRKAKRKANENSQALYKTLANFEDIIEKFDKNQKDNVVAIKETIDILIPVYNGFEFLEPLFASILKNTNSSYRLIIINDCSPDNNVDDFLKSFIKANEGTIEIIYITNEINLGFLKSVNKASKYVKNHFVLLNTDTEVPPLWIERLINPIINDENIASTTPMTNSGEICSFPKWLSDNKIYRNLDVTSVDKYFSYVCFEKNTISVPTGVGFCMGVNKKVFDKIGMFDEVFGKGYGEENDWCMRAIDNGYKNIIVPNLYVYHKHGGSFLSSEKKQLIDKHIKILHKKHPSYNERIQDLVEENPLNEMRIFLEILITFNTSKRNILMIDHELGGGTSIYRDNRIKQYLSEEENVILFSYNLLLNKYKISFYLSENKIVSYISKNFNDVKTISDFMKIDEIFLNSIVSFDSTYKIIDKLIEFKEYTKSKLVFPIHDFNCVCPSYTLLNDENIYCAVPENLNDCAKCLSNHKGTFKSFSGSQIDISQWRDSWKNIIEISDTVLCFSNSSAKIVQKVYNIQTRVKVVPHQVDNLSKVAILPTESSQINIAILGGINLAKGSLIIKEMINIIEKNDHNINIVVIGELDLDLKSQHLSVHGKYQRDDLEELLHEYKISACLIPSIWPETFSYTTEEVIMMEMPILVFDLGAPAERVMKYKNGYVIDSIDADSVIKTILQNFTKY